MSRPELLATAGAKLATALHTARAARARRPSVREEIAGLRREVATLRRELTASQTRIFDRLIEFEIRTRRDMIYAADRDAALEGGRFVTEHMAGARGFRTPPETLQYALSQAPTGGMALEFGVATGNTLRRIADSRGGRAVYGFDSFQGLPEDWITGIGKGAFARAEPPEVPGAELVVGWFDQTLPGFLAAHDGAVDFLHVDSDLYSSAVTVLTLVGPRLRPGSVVQFDEYLNYAGWQRHEHRAWTEYVERTGTTFEYLAYSWENRQVAVRITGTGDQNSVPSTGRPRSAS